MDASAAAEAAEGGLQQAPLAREEKDDVDVVSDEDPDDDDETARRRKKPRLSYLQVGSRKRAISEQVLSEAMAELHDTCQQLRLPSESRQFCDFVLVFDVFESVDDAVSPLATPRDQDVQVQVTEKRSGCCSCCQPSHKKIQECIAVRYVSIYIYIYIYSSLFTIMVEMRTNKRKK